MHSDDDERVAPARIRMLSPLGPVLLEARNGRLARVGIAATEPAQPLPAREDDAAVLAAARTQLDEYFAAQRTTFDLPLDADGTPFQEAVWAQLRAIPFGATRSYGEIAAALRRPDAARAVGAANGANPLAIVVPCHRVIGAGGALTGFAAGIERKRWLLDHEAGRLAL